MAMKMRRTSKLRGTEVAKMALRDSRLVTLVRAHPGDGSRLGQLDELAIDRFEGGTRFHTSAWPRGFVEGHYKS